MKRESFGSRLGFLLLTAGCAIGVGNVWRFPYVVGNYGGGAFVLLYLIFVAIIGVPILAMELSIGRASKKSAVKAYQKLQKPGQKWHWQGYLALIGNVVLMMFYTVYQGFFTLSIGIGAMLIFGSYTDKNRTLLGESITITTLDTVTALFAGFIIFPACAAYGVEPDSGPSLIFLTLPNVFIEMPMGRLWGSLFFIFMWFAAFATLIAVFENILACCIDLWGWSRQKASLISGIFIAVASLPCVFGFNLWAGIEPLGAGSTILDFEDFLVSNLLLPLGSLVYLIFCVSRVGWGFNKFTEECNTGKGVKIPKWAKGYLTYVLPVIVLLLFVQGLMPLFQKG